MRNTKTVELKDGLLEGSTKTFGRDIGKIFRLKEMSAMELEKWHAKAISFLIENGNLDNVAEVAKVAKEQKESSSVIASGAAFEALGDKAIKNLDGWIDLQNEHLYCYEYFDKLKGVYVGLTKENIVDYIDELTTLQYLREQALEFNCKANFQVGNR